MQHIRNYRTLVSGYCDGPTGCRIRAFDWYQNRRPWIRYALDCRKDASFGAQYKNFNEDRPILSAVRWATNRTEAAKIDIFTECSVIPQISWVVMTQRQVTLKDICGYLMLENFIGHVSGTHIVCCACCAFWTDSVDTTLGQSVV